MPTDTGIYTKNDAIIGHIHSQNLSKDLLSIIDKDKVIIDFGCGNGDYLMDFKHNGYDVIGVDGIKNVDLDFIQIEDLSTKLDLGVVGNVMSLEVGEHIPKHFEHIFIDNITRHCDNLLILSWAIIGQIGIGHINCQNNDYIIELVEKNGFVFREDITTKLRSNIEDHCDYFRNTLMIFKKL